MNCELEQRTPTFGLISDVANMFSNDYALKLFAQTCFNR